MSRAVIEPPAPATIVVNLWFIKHSNGLFHYGLDYADALSARVAEIWVRDKALAELAARRLPLVPVRILTMASMIREAVASAWTGRAIFTASSHPIPFIPRQTIVVHDSFPFQGRAGRLKRLLLRIGIASSRAHGGYINHADARHFLEACGVDARRLHYLPNRVDNETSVRGDAAIVDVRVVVGLFGTDSPKKNYDALFAAAGATEPLVAVEWRIYGHENEYTHRLRRDYPGCLVKVVGSDQCAMDRFIDAIDVAISVAEGEGFARPIARSLMRGIPTMLLDTPVFREFYAGSAQLFPNIPALVKTLAAWRAGDRLDRPTLRNAKGLREDFRSGVAQIGAVAALRR